MEFEAAGLPATTVITDVFAGIADATARTLGVPGYHYATVAHPIWTRTPEWLRAAAEDIADVVISHVTMG